MTHHILPSKILDPPLSAVSRAIAGLSVEGAGVCIDEGLGVVIEGAGVASEAKPPPRVAAEGGAVEGLGLGAGDGSAVAASVGATDGMPVGAVVGAADIVTH